MKKLFKKIIFICSAFSILAIAGQAYALDGTLGATSFVDKTIEITVNEGVLLKNIDGIVFPIWSSGSSGNQDDMDTVCVYSSAASNLYQVAVDSLEGSGTFKVKSGVNEIAYAVEWTGGIAGSFGSGTVLTDGALPTGSFTGDSSSSCSADNATLGIRITDTALNAATASVTPYTDTLTVTISPV